MSAATRAARASAVPPPSGTTASVLPVLDGAALASIPGVGVSVWDTCIDEICQQPRFAGREDWC